MIMLKFLCQICQIPQ